MNPLVQPKVVTPLSGSDFDGIQHIRVTPGCDFEVDLIRIVPNETNFCEVSLQFCKPSVT